MPKGKAKGRRGGGTTGAERRAAARERARELPAIKAIAESYDSATQREEWRKSGGDLSKWRRYASYHGQMTLHLNNDAGCDGFITLPDAIGDLASLEHGPNT